MNIGFVLQDKQGLGREDAAFSLAPSVCKWVLTTPEIRFPSLDHAMHIC